MEESYAAFGLDQAETDPPRCLPQGVFRHDPKRTGELDVRPGPRMQEKTSGSEQFRRTYFPLILGPVTSGYRPHPSSSWHAHVHCPDQKPAKRRLANLSRRGGGTESPGCGHELWLTVGFDCFDSLEDPDRRSRANLLLRHCKKRRGELQQVIG